jgi:hypothetical protein
MSVENQGPLPVAHFAAVLNWPARAGNYEGSGGGGDSFVKHCIIVMKTVESSRS